MSIQADSSQHELDLIDAHAADLFDRSTELLLGCAAIECSVHPTPGDDEGLLFVAATLLGTQFRVINRLSLSNSERYTSVLAIQGHVDHIADVSVGALGAMSMLVESVVVDDLQAAASTICSAIDVFQTGELFHAAAALMAAHSLVIAEQLALDAITVHQELRAGVDVSTSASETAAADLIVAGCRRSTGRPGRAPATRSRQTCSGRNSQCHGSRGTDSTQPNLGPFVFSH